MTKPSIETDLAYPLEDALRAAKLLSNWWYRAAVEPMPNGWYWLNADQVDIISFGIGDLKHRLRELDRVVSGPEGISPR
ncbi:hypothetical protein [Methylorubrum thiocyanatum]|uniref:hypothetical protein n=1 Tax=Methylorubrum thiocyanatum TaxID=47958 RepID=UPI00364B4ED7